MNPVRKPPKGTLQVLLRDPWFRVGVIIVAGAVAERREQFGLYVLTQCRVLPQYLWRMVFPLNLCSDHLVQTTLDFSDVTAWICATFVLALTAGLVFAWVQQWKPWALILALGLAPLLLRWLYVVSEMMVEYRTYPANALRCPVTRGIDLLLVSAAPACRHGVSLRSAWNFRTPRSSKKC